MRTYKTKKTKKKTKNLYQSSIPIPKGPSLHMALPATKAFCAIDFQTYNPSTIMRLPSSIQVYGIHDLRKKKQEGKRYLLRYLCWRRPWQNAVTI